MLRSARNLINERIEPLRREKVLGSSLEAEIELSADFDRLKLFRLMGEDVLAQLFIVGKIALRDINYDQLSAKARVHIGDTNLAVAVEKTTHHKCGRCWRHLPEVIEDGALCSRCDQVVAGMDAVA